MNNIYRRNIRRQRWRKTFTDEYVVGKGCSFSQNPEPDFFRIDQIISGDSGHSVTGKDMGFVPLSPRNLSMVVDHNEIKPNFAN